MNKIPSDGYMGIVNHWKDDVSAAISVALVALPLALGIALASGVSPMSGVLSAIIGGVVTTFFRGSYVAINGPAAGLIVVILTGVETLGDNNGSGFSYILAAIVIAGGLQMLLGLLKMGKIGDLFPASVVNGMLTTIGVIIFAKQFHVTLGLDIETKSTLDALLQIPISIMSLNPYVTFISAVSLSILIIHPRMSSSFIRKIPAPLLVMLFAIPMVLIFNLISKPGEDMYINGDYLINIPDNLLDIIYFPNFSKITDPQFWLIVVSITLVGTIETLISTKAVDKLDHFKRRTNLNKDLFAIGASSMVSGFLGGLPIITVIVRSSVNINHNAKTKWSNFYHGVILLILVFLFPVVISEIPQACLASILVYTGYKLASPQVFKSALLKGWEQLVVLLCTIVVSLTMDLLWGILTGVIVTLLIHWLLSKLNLSTFLQHLFQAEINVVEEAKNTVHVEIRGIANFAIMLKLINSLTKIGAGVKHCIVDFSRTKLVDSTVLDFIHEHREKYFIKSDFEFTGLDVHHTSSTHPLALHVLEKPMQKRLTDRQNDINHFASQKHYKFLPIINWDCTYLEKFHYFEFHLIEYQRNVLSANEESDFHWMIADVTYNDGVLMAREKHNLTVMIIHPPTNIFDVIITKEKIRQIKYKYKRIPNKDSVPLACRNLIQFLCNNASYYFESVHNKLLIYKKERLLSAKEIKELHTFGTTICSYFPNDEILMNELNTYFNLE